MVGLEGCLEQAVAILVLQSETGRSVGLQSQENPGPLLGIEQAQGDLVGPVHGQNDLRVLRSLVAELKNGSSVRPWSGGKERTRG